jgi:hypothetical protein
MNLCPLFIARATVESCEFVLLLDAAPDSGQHDSHQCLCFCGIMNGDALAMLYAEVAQLKW